MLDRVIQLTPAASVMPAAALYGGLSIDSLMTGMSKEEHRAASKGNPGARKNKKK